MRLNAFSDLCLRVVMLLAAAPDGRVLTSRQVAEAVEIPYNHVSKAMIRLRELGLVDVTRGRAGGAVLSGLGRTTTVGWLLRRLDTRPTVADCSTPNGNCPLNRDCSLRSALARAREAFYAELDAVVISSLPHENQMAPVFVTLSTLRPV
ncbi:Rrf2 family transcriptional regulator [Paenarthrobacter sp. Z7-10]|uniref:RrF2 family transcriptional regulator n=1 Tax=Paenarthrobacter sp. Z7-10 TaxID=2787635 RepID=UPI0022A92432|nr:Rrf2 family transcriptional regulator [Paenarthrobacter sp. Z7-10]MCZ2402811.1 Rrf2 family transcriptional regulator [Paenarthrobacter sp. Z7-10]